MFWDFPFICTPTSVDSFDCLVVVILSRVREYLSGFDSYSYVMLKTVPYTFSYLHLFFWGTGNQIFALALLLFETGCHVALNSPCNQEGSSICDPLACTSWMLASQRYIFMSRLFIVGTWTQHLSNGRKTLYQLSAIPALGYVLIEWFCCWVFAVPCIFWLLIPFQMRDLQMFSPIL